MSEPGLPGCRGRGAAQHRSAADRVLASWRRSEDYGLSREHLEPAFAGTDEQESLFSRCGREVLGELHGVLATEPLSLMLADADGRVLTRFSGDSALLRALDEVHLAPGFTFSEREAGTNGLGLALADRVASVVDAGQHYSTSLRGYTCAAVPVLDPVSGRLEGAVNITTRSGSPSALLLALAQSAAGTTAALMMARSRGRPERVVPRGALFRVVSAQREPWVGPAAALSPGWTAAVERAEQAFAAGRVVAAVGEPGSGRASLLAQAQRRAAPRDRVLSARPPAPQDVEAWLALWVPELGRPSTAVVVRDVDLLPAWAAALLAPLLAPVHSPLAAVGPAPAPCSITAQHFGDIPGPLAALVHTVVEVPPLRERPEDVGPLARHAARQVRGREVVLTAAAEGALRSYGWPGNVAELHHVVAEAAARADVIDVAQLPAEVLSGSRHRLTRLESSERAEIARALARPGTTMQQVADRLGIGRATLYRRVARYDLQVPRS